MTTQYFSEPSKLDMQTTGEYYAITFENLTEAAAFVAALSRYLNSPHSSIGQQPVEVWSSVLPSRVALYLSNAAKTAAAQAFSPLPPGRTCERKEFPSASKLLLGGDNLPAWGVEDAQRSLLSR